MANRFGEKIKTAMVVEEDDDVLRLREQKQALDALLRSWIDVDARAAAEQRETLEILMRTLNEDRLSDRPRFT